MIEIPTSDTPVEAEEIVEAEAAVPQPFSDEEFDEEFGIEPPVETTLAAGDQRRPCPMCGEMIMADAVKCRYCGEIFDPVLKEKERSKIGGLDEDLSTAEWVIAILCSNIGCIVSLVYLVQGKSKWKKMAIVSVCAQLVWVVIGMILGMLEEM